jgi:aspartate 1-decarboxylase
MICLNGAAARCVQVNDKIIIMAYCSMNEDDVKSHKPKVVFVDEKNKIENITSYEKHGRLSM